MHHSNETSVQGTELQQPRKYCPLFWWHLAHKRTFLLHRSGYSHRAVLGLCAGLCSYVKFLLGLRVCATSWQHRMHRLERSLCLPKEHKISQVRWRLKQHWFFFYDLSRHGLRYTIVLCIGISRSYSAVRNSKVYRSIDVHKEDCINHVQERMGSALQNSVRKSEDRECISGKGRLTRDLITTLSSYHTQAIWRRCNQLWWSHYFDRWQATQPQSVPKWWKHNAAIVEK